MQFWVKGLRVFADDRGARNGVLKSGNIDQLLARLRGEDVPRPGLVPMWQGVRVVLEHGQNASGSEYHFQSLDSTKSIAAAFTRRFRTRGRKHGTSRFQQVKEALETVLIRYRKAVRTSTSLFCFCTPVS